MPLTLGTVNPTVSLSVGGGDIEPNGAVECEVSEGVCVGNIEPNGAVDFGVSGSNCGFFLGINKTKERLTLHVQIHFCCHFLNNRTDTYFFLFLFENKHCL